MQPLSYGCTWEVAKHERSVSSVRLFNRSGDQAFLMLVPFLFPLSHVPMFFFP